MYDRAHVAFQSVRSRLARAEARLAEMVAILQAIEPNTFACDRDPSCDYEAGESEEAPEEALPRKDWCANCDLHTRINAALAASRTGATGEGE